MILIKTQEEIKTMKVGGKILAKILKRLASEVKPGVTSEELEVLACKLIKEAGGRPAFKDFAPMPDDKKYPTALCVSVNDEVVHAPAIPTRVFIRGDIVGIDVGMEYPYGEDNEGKYTDTAVTVAVGKVDKRVEKLMKVTKKSLDLAIKVIKPGATINDIGKAVEDHVVKNGFSVVKELVGHGVGRGVHEDPQIPNFYAGPNYDTVIEEGMTLAIEPMVNMGGWKVVTDKDGFTIKTADGSLSAHFEHTIAVTKNGCIIITK